MAIAPSALSHLDASYNLFCQVSENSRTSKILVCDHSYTQLLVNDVGQPILQKLRERAHSAIANANSPSPSHPRLGQVIKSEDDEFAALGGATRLVSRRKSSSPSTAGSPTSQPSSPPLVSAETMQQGTLYQEPQQIQYQNMPQQWNSYGQQPSAEYSNFGPFTPTAGHHYPQPSQGVSPPQNSIQNVQQYYSYPDVNMHTYQGGYDQPLYGNSYSNGMNMEYANNGGPDLNTTWNNFVTK